LRLRGYAPAPASLERPRNQSLRRSLLVLGASLALALVAVRAGCVEARVYRVAVISLSLTPDRERVHVTFGPPPDESAIGAALAPASVGHVVSPEAPPVHGHVGDRRSFWVQWFDPSARSRPTKWNSIRATLLYSTQHADIWVDDSVAPHLAPDITSALPRDAENAWQSQHGRFGSLSYDEHDVARHRRAEACDPMTHRPVGSVPAFVPSRGELLNLLIVSGEKARNGYAAVDSYRYQDDLDCYWNSRSNELPGLVVWPFEQRRAPEVSNGVLVYQPAHELQHLKYFVRHDIRGTYSGESMPMINEGLSMLAEDFAVNALFNKPHDLFGAGFNAGIYLHDPNAVSLLAFGIYDGREAHPFGTACYGGAYLLQRFLYDRFGEAYLNAVTDTDADGLSAMKVALPVSVAEAFREFGRYLIAPPNQIFEDGYFNLYQEGESEVGTRFALSGPRLAVIPGPDFEILGGSASLYVSDIPISNIRSNGAPIVWTQVEDDSATSDSKPGEGL